MVPPSEVRASSHARHSVLIVDHPELAGILRPLVAGIVEVDADSVPQHIGIADVVVASPSASMADGEELLGRLRRTHPKIMRILVVEDTEVQLAIDALADGRVQRFFSRSWDRGAICHVISHALGEVRKVRTRSHVVGVRTDHRPSLVDIVDDDIHIRRTLQRILGHHGYRTRAFADGAAAIRATFDEPPAVALVDLVLPNLGGLEVVRHLKGMFRGVVPVIVMSGLSDSDARLEAVWAGADDFLVKPTTHEKVVDRIELFVRMGEAYGEVRQLTRLAEHLARHAQESASLLAHHLHNGLAIAGLNVDVLDEEDSLSPDGQHALSSTKAILTKLATLVSNFVDITRFEEKGLVVRPVLTNIHVLLAHVASVHRAIADDLDVEIHLECQPDVEHSIDAVLIERVVQNLVGNSLRYAGVGGSVRLFAGYDGQALTIEVGNTGAGIPQVMADTLFEKFGRGADGGARWGMGLYFCAIACQAHGGTIQLAPRPGLGANFRMTLPGPMTSQREYRSTPTT